MARDIVSRTLAEQITHARATGNPVDVQAVREAVYAEQRGDHLGPEDLDRMAQAEYARAQQLVATPPTDRGGSTRITDAIIAKRHAGELHRLADSRRGSQE